MHILFKHLLIMLTLVGCQYKPNISKNQSQSQYPTPSEVVANSKHQDWRKLDLNNTLYMTLEHGVVVMELLPELAPNHVANTIALVKQGIFDGTNFYRVIDGFVAQGGPLYESENELKPLSAGAYQIAAEFTSTSDLGDSFVLFDNQDGFADETGFVKSFAVGRDLDSGESWLLHCYGALAMGRSNDINTGGTALYVVNGPSQRYLDRNTTVFGRVISGMQHIQALQRGATLQGVVDLTEQNVIQSIQVAADMPTEEVMAIEVLDSNSDAFKQLLASRKNRTGDWFVYQHDYMDACGIPVPVRLHGQFD